MLIVKSTEERGMGEMTAREAVEVTTELLEFVRKRLPGHDDMEHVLQVLRDTTEHMAVQEWEQEQSLVLGNLKTGEVRCVDSRDWMKYGVEWMDDAELRPRDGQKGGERRDGK